MADFHTALACTLCGRPVGKYRVRHNDLSDLWEAMYAHMRRKHPRARLVSTPAKPRPSHDA